VKLPGKKIFGTFDPEVIRSRRHAVRDFVSKLIADPELLQYEAVRTFLSLDGSRPGSRCDETDDEAYYSGQSRISTRRNSTDGGGGGEQLLLVPEGCYTADEKHIKPTDFEFLSVIGKGSFGKVLLARHRQEQTLLAVKLLSKELIVSNNEVDHIMCERRVLSLNTAHPFLVGLHSSFQTKDKLYLVMDYVSGGELFFRLQKEKRFSESRTRFYGAEIASALGYLHVNNIIYRDLKPENILLDAEGHVMLTDFGLCKEGVGEATTFCGTAEYLCPELLRREPYDRAVDWWCLGAVMYEMITGLPPFYSRNQAEMYERILSAPLEFKKDVVSPPARSLLSELLVKDKNQRLGCHGDFDDVRSHAFFSSIDWGLLAQRKLAPPFVPDLSEKTDVSNFDSDFTNEQIPESVMRSDGDRLAATTSGDTATAATTDRTTATLTGGEFNGFTYERPVEEVFCF